jgi:bifunctional non-homologous end joining protein LigD
LISWTHSGPPGIAEALRALRVTSATLDGEAVVCNARGVSDFDRLRSALARRGSRDAFLFAFDLLELDGNDLRREPWTVRRETLASLLRKAGDGIRLSEHLDGTDGATVFGHACAMGLEGIVAKRRDRPYRSGRSPDWIKVKNPAAPAATRIMEW